MRRAAAGDGLVGVVAAGAGCAHPSTQRATVPPDTATAPVVVTQYTNAVTSGDCTVAAALYPGRDAATRPCPDRALRATTVGAVSRVDPRVWGRGRGGEVVEVMVTRSRAEPGPWGLGERVVEAPWSYRLERSGPNRPWRIIADGLG